MRNLMQSRLVRTASLLLLIFVLAACSGSEPTAQTQEGQRRQDSYDALTERQPAKAMNYSPTRETVNGWVDTWNDPGQVSYVYITAQGEPTGYYVFKGLPVSYCAMLTPSYELVDGDGDGDSWPDFQVPAPGIDGAYYSGGQCNQYYGFDAETGTYYEFTVGGDQNYFLSTEPMIRYEDAQPLGDATVESQQQ